ncbi:MAG: MFS transporter [Rhizobiaceae bacterium]|nr:MFS transporter [Rhizobiaceae bacterium]
MDATSHFFAARRARWAVASIFLINGFMSGSWAPQIPLVLTRLGITESTLGLLILCFGTGALVSMPWCGWMMGRFGERGVLRTVALLQGTGLLLVVLSPSVGVTAVAMLIFGALVGCTDVAMNAATVTVERRMGKAVMSSMHGFWSLGGFVGGALGGIALQQYGALPHAIGVAVIAIAVCIAAVPHLLPSMPSAAASQKRGGLSMPTSPTVYMLGLMALLLFVSEGVVLDWGALYLNRDRGADIAVAGLAYAFFAGAMAIMRFAGDVIRNRYGAVPTLRVCTLIAAVAMASAGFLENPYLIIAAFAVAGLALANTVPIVFSASGNLPNVSSGAGVSVATTMGYSGILLAPSPIGFMAEHVGYTPVFAVMGGLIFVVFLMSGLAHTADYDHGKATE